MPPDFSDIPIGARPLTAMGDLTTEAVSRLFRSDQTTIFPVEETEDFTPLADSLRRGGWSDQESADLLGHFAQALADGRRIPLSVLARWVLSHPNDSQAVKDCLAVDPPSEIEIIRVLSRRGSQKLVFLATWRLQQREVVLKRFLAQDDKIDREMRAHPLSLSHPNIIETHKLQNAAGEQFLVERRLPVVLDDEWNSEGVHEAANLLFDIGSAVRFLHDHGLVHGDVKPDNIGKEGDDYVLLDFGICRPVNKYTVELTATGSIRTRAPELLILESGTSPEDFDPRKCDVWALGATLYNAVARRFPLIDYDEPIPRVSNPVPRRTFERLLAKRAKNEWDSWVCLDRVPEALREILGAALASDPQVRISASDLVARAQNELPAFLRSKDTHDGVIGRFSPIEAFRQIREYLDGIGDPAMVPQPRRQKLDTRLGALVEMPGFSPEDRKQIQQLRSDLQVREV